MADKIHPNVTAAMQDVLNEAALVGMNRTETAGMLLGMAWGLIAGKEGSERANTWLAEMAVTSAQLPVPEARKN